LALTDIKGGAMIKLRVDERNSSRVKFTMFLGERGLTLHNAGHLAFSPAEFRDFTEMLNSTGSDIEVEEEL
jgi:hypothetical protein